jgi:hypothetical protein
MKDRELNKKELSLFLDSRNSDLYSRLYNEHPFQVVSSNDYSCSFDPGGEPFIRLDLDHISPGAFAHELLHIAFLRRTDGFYFGNNLSSSQMAENRGLFMVANELLNYLHHFCFYQEFLQMGYGMEDFLKTAGKKEYSLEQLHGFSNNRYRLLSSSFYLLCHSILGIDYDEEMLYLQNTYPALIMKLEEMRDKWSRLCNQNRLLRRTKIQICFGLPFLCFLYSFLSGNESYTNLQ